jgi:hypothetical protein
VNGIRFVMSCSPVGAYQSFGEIYTTIFRAGYETMLMFIFCYCNRKYSSTTEAFSHALRNKQHNYWPIRCYITHCSWESVANWSDISKSYYQSLPCSIMLLRKCHLKNPENTKNHIPWRGSTDSLFLKSFTFLCSERRSLFSDFVWIEIEIESILYWLHFLRYVDWISGPVFCYSTQCLEVRVTQTINRFPDPTQQIGNFSGWFISCTHKAEETDLTADIIDKFHRRSMFGG